MKAPHADQLKLLRLASLDAQIARLQKENQQHPLRKELGALVNAIAACSRDQRAAATREEEAAKSLAEAEKNSASIHEQIAVREEKYNSGIGLTSRDLLTLEDEMATLRTQLEGLSSTEFAALEEVEASEEHTRMLATRYDELTQKMLAVKSELEDIAAEIEADIARIQKQRDTVASEIEQKLVAFYEKAASTGGYSVLALTPDGHTTGGISLSPVEVALVKNKAEDEVYFSEDYGCIIVPVAHGELPEE